MSHLQYIYGLASATGTSRKLNCDTTFVRIWSDIPRFNGQDIGLFIVADGLGVTENWGLAASRLAVEIVSQEIETYISQPGDLSISQMMTASVQKANLKIITDIPDGGTTLTATLLIGNQFHIAHVGDSRLYCISGDTVTLMTNDHSHMSRFITIIDPISPPYEVPPLSRVLWRALGQLETVDVDFRSEQVAQNTQLLLCTDGLIALDAELTEADLQPVIANHDPQIACDQLVELAQKHGSTDDITAMVIKIVQE